MTDNSVDGLAAMARQIAREGALNLAMHASTRNLLRPNLAHWELAELFKYCLPLALHDVVWGSDFFTFRNRWIGDLGMGIGPHLLGLYVAATCSSAIVPEGRADAVTQAIAASDEEDW